MNTLTNRYLAATLRSVPAQRRDEIATELRASIEDMIEGRTGGGDGPDRPPSGRCSPSWATRTCWPPGTPTAGCSSSARPTTWSGCAC